MSTSTLQYAIAGLLGVAWVWMLGRPLLISALKKSRRNSIGYFREQQAALASVGEYPEPEPSLWERRPRPFSSWLNQPAESRRLQMLLGSALATFGTLLLAIALNGMFWSLFVVAALCFAAYVSFAAYIGASRLRHHEAQNQVRRQAVISAEQERRLLTAQAIIDAAPEEYEHESIFQQQSLFGAPEIEHSHLNQHKADELVVDEYVVDDDVDDEDLSDKDIVDDYHSLADQEPIDAVTSVAMTPDFDDNGASASEDSESVTVADSFFEPIPEFSVSPLDVHAMVAELVETGYEDAKFPADFTPDPTSELVIDHLDSSDRVSKPLRPKSGSRPIYIESQLDDVDARRAVND